MKTFVFSAVVVCAVLVVTPILIGIFASRERGRKLLMKSLKQHGVDTALFPGKFYEECVTEAYDYAKAAAKSSGKPFREIFTNVIERNAIIIKAILKEPSSADMNPDMRDRLIRFGILY